MASLMARFSSRNQSSSVEKVLVVGAGAIGLRTALELLRRNVSVVVEAPRHPLHPSTCSMGAGGLWMPFHIQDDRASRWATETLDELMPMAADPDNDLVEIVPTVVLQQERGGQPGADFLSSYDATAPGAYSKASMLPEWTMDTRIKFQQMTVEMLSWQNIVFRLNIPPEQELKEAGFQHAWLFRPPVVDAPKMLEHLLNEISDYPNAAVNIETGIEYVSVEQMRDQAAMLGCDALVNCTGLGAASICHDEKLIGARGILLHFERSSCVRRDAVRESAYGANVNDTIIMTEDVWGSETMPCYLIPRGDTVLVGGSYLEGDTEVTIRDDERELLLLNANRMGIDIERSKKVGEWTGFRPFRTKVRCEMDTEASDSNGVKVFHSYGHGGSGWTVNVGAAKECADLVLGGST
jgi:D-amino-acid oxidase